MNITERLDAARLEVQNQTQAIDQLREDRTSWRFFYGELTAGAAIATGEIGLTVLRHKMPNNFRDSWKWKAIETAWRGAEVAIGTGIVLFRDKQISVQIDDSESQLDWDSRQIRRVEGLFADEFLGIYRDYPLAPGG